MKTILKTLKAIEDKLDMLLRIGQVSIEMDPDLKQRFDGMRVPEKTECAGDCPECECK